MAISTELFSGASVPASFTESDPQGDVTNTVGSGVLTISVPGSVDHDWYRTNQNRMLLWQSHDDSDFDVTLKFDADLALIGSFKVVGIGVTDSSENAYVRASIYSNSSQRRAFFYGYNGSEGEVTEADINLSFQTVRYLRLIYDSSAGEFEMQYSADATTWTSVGTMTYTMSADRVGILAGNATGASSPAFSIDIDEWTNNAASSSIDDDITEGAEAGDTFAETLNAAVSVAESGEAGDTFAAIATILSAVSEGGEAGDIMSATISAMASMSEGASAGDAFSSLLAVADSMSEGASAGDTFDAIVSLINAVSEGGSAGDTFAGSMTMLSSMVDGAVAGDIVTAIMTAASVISEGASAGDVFSAGLALGSGFSEGASAGDAFGATVALINSLTEGAVAGDTFISELSQSSSAISEGANAGSVFVATVVYIASITEGAVAGDTFTRPGAAVYAEGTPVLYARSSGEVFVNP